MFIGLSSVGLYETLCIIVKDRFSIDLKSILSKVFGVEDGENKPIEEDKKEVLKVQDKLEEKIDNNVKDEVHITKQDYLNRLNALKNKK